MMFYYFPTFEVRSFCHNLCWVLKRPGCHIGWLSFLQWIFFEALLKFLLIDAFSSSSSWSTKYTWPQSPAWIPQTPLSPGSVILQPLMLLCTIAIVELGCIFRDGLLVAITTVDYNVYLLRRGKSLDINTNPQPAQHLIATTMFQEEENICTHMHVPNVSLVPLLGISSGAQYVTLQKC